MHAIDSWQLKGKLAYRNNEDSGSLWFDWTQQDDSYNIYLSGPFGVGTVQLSGNSQIITLSQPGEADISSHSASALTQRLFGWHLPVEQIRFWIRGLPASSSANAIKVFNDKGLPETLQEEGWQLNISRYQAETRGQLPGKIKGHNGTLTFTLLLKDWSFNNSVADPSQHIQ